MTDHSRLSVFQARAARTAAALSLALAAAGCPLQVPGIDGSIPGLTSVDFSGSPAAAGALTLPQNQSATVTVRLVGATGAVDPKLIGWSSSDTSVATVSPATGPTVTVTPLKAGSAVITASAGGRSASFTVTVPAVVASLVINGADAAALGDTQTYTVTAKDASGAAVALTAGFSWSADSDLFTLGAGADSSSTSLRVIDAGQGTLVVSYGQITANKRVHATATSVGVAAAAQTSVAGTAVTVTATAVGSTAAITGRAARTAWTVSGAGCTVSPAVGATTAVNATGGVACVVTGTLDTTLTASATVTFTAPQVPASLTIAGADFLDVKAAASTYTATVKDAKGNVITGAAVSWASASGSALTVTPASGATTTAVGNGVGTVVLQATSSGLNPVTKSITINPVTLAVSPASVNLLQSPSKTAPIVAHASLQAKDGGGNLVPFLAPLAFGAGLSETHLPNDTNFNFLQPGALAADGSLPLNFYDVGVVGTAHTITLTAFGKNATLATTVAAPDVVALALKPGDTASVGSSLTVTPSVTVGGASVDGAVVALTQGGDAIFASASVPASVTVPNGFSPLLAHLGKATITPAALGKTGGAVTIWAVPGSIGATAGAAALSTTTPLALQLGAAATAVAVVAQNASRGTIDLAGEGAKGGTLAGSITSGAAVTTTCVSSGPGLSCPLTAAAAGTATLHVVWTSQDVARTASADFPLSVTAAAAPVFGAGSFTATWTGPVDYALSFPAATASAGTVAYDLYASSAAGADTDDAVLFAAVNKTAGVATTGTGLLAASFTAPAGGFSSRWAFGIKANTPVSSDSAAQRLALQTSAPSGPPAVAFIAGRTVFQVSLAGAIKPLFTVGPLAATAQLERTAPRLSALDAVVNRGLAGVALSGQAQQLYARGPTDTSAAARPAGASVQTDAASCASSSLVRPTVALQALVNGAATPIFTVTPQFHACDSAQLIAVTATGAQELAGHYVDQVAQLGDAKLVIADRGSLSLLDLAGATAVETVIAAGKLASGALVAAVPVPGGADAATVYTLDASNGLRSYGLGALPATPATVSDAATVFTGAFAAAGTPVRMIAVEAAHLVVELSGTGGAHTLWSLATAAGAPAPAKLADASVILDQPTLGSTTAAGH